MERIQVSDEEFDWLLAKLDEPPRDLPKLKELMNRPSPFGSEA